MFIHFFTLNQVIYCEQANCLILAPDDFKGTIAESYDAAAWKVAESAGLVCLPAAGYRAGTFVALAGGGGLYWSSSAHDENYAYDLGFTSYDVFPGGHASRDGAFSVRLVTGVNSNAKFHQENI